MCVCVEHCKKPLDEHLATHFDGKVKVVHQARREGLIRTRLTGAKAATGQVLIFLDSHVEANINWLPPLLGLLLCHCLSVCLSVCYTARVCVCLLHCPDVCMCLVTEPIAQDYRTVVCYTARVCLSVCLSVTLP